jgi:N4-gp56 family major capsid protein
MANERMYNDPAGGTDSDIGKQFNTFKYKKKALIEIVKEQYFTQLADVEAMPKHFGKTIKRYHYMPLLDDRNINDQGLDASGASYANGNLYGSSKDVGAILGKLPALSETGGRVNRVGFTRLELEGSIEKFGFFEEYTQESLDFDTDEDLEMHVNREMLRGANEITEDALQIDLLNAAGVVRYGGEATSVATVTGEQGATASIIDYEDLMRLAIDLDDNRCPKNTQVITGSRMIDTKVISAARVLYIGSELIPMVKRMVDLHGNPAFVDVKHYAEAGNTLRGEIGSIDQFRIVVVPEMMHWEGAGATETTNDGYRATGGKYDVFPMLVVGSKSFTTIGFQTDGQSVKFKVYNKKPGEQTADRNDPYGEMGFMSIKWYYGTMILRPEWIAVAKCVAEI